MFRIQPVSCFNVHSFLCRGVLIVFLRQYFQFKPFQAMFLLHILAAIRVVLQKGVLKNVAKFTRKRLCQSLFFYKNAGLRHRFFTVNFAKFLRAPFLPNTSGRLLLNQKMFFYIFRKHRKVPLLCSLSICSEKMRKLFFNILTGYRKKTLAWNEIRKYRELDDFFC